MTWIDNFPPFDFTNTRTPYVSDHAQCVHVIVFSKQVVGYNLQISLGVDETALEEAKRSVGRLIIATYAGEVVLDPFMGSGQTAIAALKAGRHYVGYETEGEYVKLAEKRIKKYKTEDKTS